MSSAFELADKLNTNVTSYHILYVLLEDTEKYIENLLSPLTINVDKLKLEIYLLFNKSEKQKNNKEIEKSILKLINTAKMLSKQFDDSVITEEILLLSFTLINDKAKEILSKFDITYFEI